MILDFVKEANQKKKQKTEDGPKYQENKVSVDEVVVGQATTFNIPRSAVLGMDDEERYVFYEKFRLHLLEKYKNEKTPIGGTNLTKSQIIRKFQKLIDQDIHDSTIFKIVNGKKILKGYKDPGNCVNHWFPEMVDVKVSGHYSVFDQLRDKEMFYKKMDRIILGDKLKVFRGNNSDRRIYKPLNSALKVVSGAQHVTNIRTTVAKYIWLESIVTTCKDQDDIVVWDPSMGWAGRLISFMSIYSNIRDEKGFEGKKLIYIGTDPNTKIFDRYSQIVKFWQKEIFIKAPFDVNVEVHPLCIGSEEFRNTELFEKYAGRGSVVYTSPPYFAKEEYSNDLKQSYKQYPEYEGWKNDFLKPTIQTAYDFLAPGKNFCWNIADINYKGKKLSLENDSLDAAEDAGFKFKEVLHMLMRGFPGRDSSSENIEKQIQQGINFVDEGTRKKVKYEPVFIFTK